MHAKADIGQVLRVDLMSARPDQAPLAFSLRRATQSAGALARAVVPRSSNKWVRKSAWAGASR